MPLKILNVTTGTITERLDRFRRTIKAGEAFEIFEVAAHRTVCAAESTIRPLIKKNGWGIQMLIPSKNKMAAVLVNPKTLAKYARKT